MIILDVIHLIICNKKTGGLLHQNNAPGNDRRAIGMNLNVLTAAPFQQFPHQNTSFVIIHAGMNWGLAILIAVIAHKRLAVGEISDGDGGGVHGFNRLSFPP